MKATVLDLRRRMGEVLQALDRNETVTLMHRGKKKGVIYPRGKAADKALHAREHPAIGMWKDRDDMKRPSAYVRAMRKGRFDAV